VSESVTIHRNCCPAKYLSVFADHTSSSTSGDVYVDITPVLATLGLSLRPELHFAEEQYFCKQPHDKSHPGLHQSAPYRGKLGGRDAFNQMLSITNRLKSTTCEVRKIQMTTLMKEKRPNIEINRPAWK